MVLQTLVSALLAASYSLGQAADVQEVLRQFNAVRPAESELALYRLDWAPTLKEAMTRAANEHRPIFLIIVTNSFGNIYTGHC
jgi:hypothetical protein